MATMTTHAPGTFCWVELCSTDAEGARSFYTTLFGWTTRDAPIPGGVYIMCQLDGHEVAAMYQMDAEQRARNEPSHWFAYVAVTNVDETASRVEELGGKLVTPPFDVAEHGRMAVVQDPTGAYVGLWQGKNHPGVGVRDEPNSLCWDELMTPDRVKAATFFSKLIGWELSSMEIPGGEYTVFMGEGTPKGGCLQITPDMGEVPPNWMNYFEVADCDAAVARTKELGGAVVAGPGVAPGIGKWAILKDPQGGHFAIITHSKD